MSNAHSVFSAASITAMMREPYGTNDAGEVGIRVDCGQAKLVSGDDGEVRGVGASQDRFGRASRGKSQTV